LAVAGNLVSFEYESGFLCGAINSSSWGYGTFALGKNGKFLFYPPNNSNPLQTNEPTDISLSSLFSEEDIFRALIANERISADIFKLVNQAKIKSGPRNLAELKTMFETFKYDFLDGMFDLNANALEGFALHHVSGDKVSVWISLTPSSRASQSVHESLEILLPIPGKLREAFELADSTKEGFLMKTASQFVGASSTKFEFGGRSR